jgi:hypothetical protein
MPRLHGFHRLLPRLWELFLRAIGSGITGAISADELLLNPSSVGL